jgi:hypothetical protein
VPQPERNAQSLERIEGHIAEAAFVYHSEEDKPDDT